MLRPPSIGRGVTVVRSLRERDPARGASGLLFVMGTDRGRRLPGRGENHGRTAEGAARSVLPGARGADRRDGQLMPVPRLFCPVSRPGSRGARSSSPAALRPPTWLSPPYRIRRRAGGPPLTRDPPGQGPGLAAAPTAPRTGPDR